MLSWSKCCTQIILLGLSLGIKYVTIVPTQPKRKSIQFPFQIAISQSLTYVVQMNCQLCCFPKKLMLKVLIFMQNNSDLLQLANFVTVNLVHKFSNLLSHITVRSIAQNLCQ